MKTKEKLLELFESKKGLYFSGEEIAGQLHISRTAVWKAVKSLRGDGYHIDAVPNKGYCMSVETDILSAQGIEKYLDGYCAGLRINVYSEVDSTNSRMRALASNGEKEGCVVIANRQNAGRGRVGRSFYSPADTGIYMSLLLRPQNYTPQKAVRITTMAAVAVCEAIESLTEEKAQIKWVNDIFIGGKKVCGILTEASFGMESGCLDYAVLGIGINVYAPDGGFPDGVDSIAGVVFREAKDDGKNRLAAEVLKRFISYYMAKEYHEYVEKYRSRSLVLGREIRVLLPDQTRTAVALEIDDECHLLVEYEDGTQENLNSGEVSVRITPDGGMR